MKLNTVQEQNIIVNNEPSAFLSLYTIYTIIIFSSISLTSSLFYLAYRYYIRSNNDKIQFNIISTFINVVKQRKEKYGTYNNITVLKDTPSSENGNTNTLTTSESENLSNNESNIINESNKSVTSIIKSKKDILYTKVSFLFWYIITCIISKIRY